MLKYLLLFLVVLWLWHSPAIRGLLKGKKPEAAPPTRPGPKPTGNEPDQIVPCAHCGVHLPFKDAVLDIGGRVYCGDAHRTAGPRRP
ncbi:MAG: hypothetical protein I8H76_00715 [Burkholderiales bacterium]|nr:hypothetical protein [Burkholderiales bacterium]MBH2017465.1 hypothetical protein [Burkholderiales bacterium]